MKENNFWLRKQDSISEKYFKRNEFSDFINRHKKLNSVGSARPQMVKTADNGLYYYTKDSDSISILYSYDLRTNLENVVFDPSKSQEKISLSYYNPSPDGKYIMITHFENQEETIFVYNVIKQKLVNTGLKDFHSDLLDWVQWLPNNSFTYTGFPESDSFNDAYVRIHNIANNSNKIVYSDKVNINKVNPNGIPVSYTYPKQPNKLFVYEADASEHYNCFSLDITSLAKVGKFDWEKLFDKNDSIIYYAEFDESSAFYKQVKNGQIVLASSPVDNLDIKNPNIIVKAEEGKSIDDFSVSAQGIFYTLSNGITEEMFLKKNKSEISKIPLNYPIGSINFKSSWGVSDSISIVYEGWNINKTEAIVNGSMNNYHIIGKFGRKNIEELSDIEVDVLQVESYDGTLVPMSVVKPKNYTPSRDSKAIILAYGAYGYSLDAYYDSMLLDFVSQNNVLVVAHIRGGGEKGHKWYEEGIMDKKINSWKDLIACSEYTKSQIINNEKLGILVESAGGISAAMAINERPDLFKAISGINLTLNPIRIADNPNYTEDDNAYDFGTTETKEGFKSLLALDPVLNIDKTADYPATYLMCGDEDELIPISEPSKYIAILQSIQVDKSKPILLNVNFGVGHDYDDYTVDFGKAIFFLNQELSK
ncbi:prolyl oligopeptidase family serine peptidase [Flagellimonas onchidii]|uniref:prolyl oligopeptidase family serine peptidase n=1 Tax=Flagellimonas onchidii TaxID=2562684 RepID=UPI00145607EC|nr:prolyl oligopeptidase family serine peptidase [Allomuricauda onchidii]